MQHIGGVSFWFESSIVKNFDETFTSILMIIIGAFFIYSSYSLSSLIVSLEKKILEEYKKFLIPENIYTYKINIKETKTSTNTKIIEKLLENNIKIELSKEEMIFKDQEMMYQEYPEQLINFLKEQRIDFIISTYKHIKLNNLKDK